MNPLSIVLLLITLVLPYANCDFKPEVSVHYEKEVSQGYIYFDDSSNILSLRGGKVKLSKNDGKEWVDVEIPADTVIAFLSLDELNAGRAFAYTDTLTQYYTFDYGESWQKFEIDEKDVKHSMFHQVIPNSKDPSLYLIEYDVCSDIPLDDSSDMFNFGRDPCTSKYVYTTDAFKSIKKLDVKAERCKFALGKEFDKGKPESIICIDTKYNSFGYVTTSDLIISDNFFKTSSVVNHNYPKTGKILDVLIYQKFMIAVIQNDKFNKKSGVTILVSKDGKTFQKSNFSNPVRYGAIEFLESTSPFIFLSVTTFKGGFLGGAYTTIYSSDSSGLNFDVVIDNVVSGTMKKAETIDAVWFANTADSDGDSKGSFSLIDLLHGGGFSKSSKSVITFNDGKDWAPIKVDDEECKDDCSLHLFSVGEFSSDGRMVTGPTPAILFGIGNTGKQLDSKIENFSTYFSRDGGATWKLAIKEPCAFSFGDLGNIVLAVSGYGDMNALSKKVYYSTDQGVTWSDIELEKPIFILDLMTTRDGTGTKFLLNGMVDNTPDKQDDFDFSEASYAIDFLKAFDRKCEKDDYEEVYARVDFDKKPLCMYGHTEKFKRRKADAKCFAATLYEDITVYDTACKCTIMDFECAPGFKLDSKNECVLDKKAITEMCGEQKIKQLKLPNMVKIQDDECELDSKLEKDFIKEFTIKCSDYPSDLKNKIKVHAYDLEDKVVSYSYFEQGNDFEGENIIIRTADKKLYASRDGGQEFVKVPIYDDIEYYAMGTVPGHVTLVTSSERIYISENAGNSYLKVDTPGPLSQPFVAYSKNSTQKLIVYVANSNNCFGDVFSPECLKTAYLTVNGGHDFTKLREDVIRCEFIGETFDPKYKPNENTIYCTVVDFESGKMKLVSSENSFSDEKEISNDVVGYAVSGQFVVVGEVTKDQKLNAKVTVDGKKFADAALPSDLNIDIKEAFTVLEGETGSIFIHVTTRNDKDLEYGALLKSNSNGTSYSLSLDYVNRNRVGYVDYDRIQGIEGILISNVVDNHKSKLNKKYKTMISHNDGGSWQYLKAPKDSKCTGKTIKDCSLNLHGFTEREDYRDTFSSPSAIGIMFGIGNVGAHLTSKEKGDTFLTTDGGVSWKHVRKGNYMWEYGDRGSLLVLVKDGKTKKLSFSLNQGHKWKDFEFTSEEVEVTDIATVPSDNSRKFLIFTKKDGKTKVFGVDFSGLYKRQCQLDLDNPDKDDFEYWSPKHPESTESCLFGHEAKYLRRAKGSEDCFIGMAPLTDGYKVVKNCACTRNDYECDYNYYRESDNTCKLIKGLSPSDHKKEMCKKNAFEYFEPTGYRRVPLSTCKRGKQFDSFIPKACPGKTKEFNKHYGRDIGVGKLLLIIGLPMAIAIFATWFVYDRGIRRNGGFKQFGQIRLDEDDFDFHPIENNEVDKVVNSIVKGGIYTAAFTVATFKTLRAVDKMIFNKLIGRFFGRAGQRSYVSVPDIDEEEEELFGNFQDNYEDELQHGDENLRQSFDDGIDRDPFVDEEDPEPVVSDERLFDIDDQSDGEDLGKS